VVSLIFAVPGVIGIGKPIKWDILQKDKIPLISAHRGASHDAPENTLAAFAKAIDLGADFLEIDVRTTADQAQVIVHDSSLKRTTGLDEKVENTRLADIRNLSAGGWFAREFENEGVPTLEEVCALVSTENKKHQRQASLYVDCKDIRAAVVVQILRKYHLLKSAVFYGDVRTLSEIKKQFADARLMPAFPGSEEMAKIIDALHPYAVDMSYDDLSEETLSYCHDKGIKVFSDLLGEDDTESAYRKAIRLGIDLIQTDKVSAVLRTRSTQELQK